MNLSVLIPTYRRPQDLIRCLEALGSQTRLAEQIVVVARIDDSATANALSHWLSKLPLSIVKVDQPGQVYALNAGLQACTGEVIAITDDDAAPRTKWLETIEAHFSANPHVGGVGGRDWVHQGEQVIDGKRSPVGKVQWFGRVIGNHHLGFGSVREVDVLKGANMSYRRTAIGDLRFDERLRGTGAQVHNDMGFSLCLKRQGWKLIYDPAVAVDHYPAQRFDEDQRETFNFKAVKNAVHNEMLVLLEHLPFWRWPLFLIWAFWVGHRASPGVLQALRLRWILQRCDAWHYWLAALLGKVAGMKTFFSGL